jgi:hypothetical protein
MGLYSSSIWLPWITPADALKATRSQSWLLNGWRELPAKTTPQKGDRLVATVSAGRGVVLLDSHSQLLGTHFRLARELSRSFAFSVLCHIEDGQGLILQGDVMGRAVATFVNDPRAFDWKVPARTTPESWTRISPDLPVKIRRFRREGCEDSAEKLANALGLEPALAVGGSRHADVSTAQGRASRAWALLRPRSGPDAGDTDASLINLGKGLGLNVGEVEAEPPDPIRRCSPELHRLSGLNRGTLETVYWATVKKLKQANAWKRGMARVAAVEPLLKTDPQAAQIRAQGAWTDQLWDMVFWNLRD